MKPPFLLIALSLVVVACSPDVSNVKPGSLRVRAALLEGAAGSTAQATATATSTTGRELDLSKEARWSSSNAAVVTVRGDGSVRFVAPGSATLTAVFEAQRADVQLSVLSENELVLAPGIESLAQGQQQQFRAVISSNGLVRDVTMAAAWTFEGALEATSTHGEALAVGMGVAFITVTIDGRTATRSLQVSARAPTSTRVQVEQPVLKLNLSTTLRLIEAYGDGSTRDVTNEATWASSNERVATIDSPGVLSARASGLSVVTALRNGVFSSAGVTVEPAQLVAISLDRERLSLPVGVSGQVRVYAHYDDGSRWPITATSSFSTDDAAVVELHPNGLLTARAQGHANLLADFRGHHAALEVDVNEAQLIALSTSVPRVRLSPGQGVDFTIAGTFTDGSTHDLSSQTTITTTGLVQTRQSNGAVKLSALKAGLEHLVLRTGARELGLDVEITNHALSTLTVTLETDGRALATARWVDGLELDVTQLADWSVAQNLSARVDNTPGLRGTLTLDGPGDVLLVARFGGVASTLFIVR